jgi:hypothetical protein
MSAVLVVVCRHIEAVLLAVADCRSANITTQENCTIVTLRGGTGQDTQRHRQGQWVPATVSGLKAGAGAHCRACMHSVRRPTLSTHGHHAG